MAWPWAFLDLTHEERQARRLVLDRYGHYALLVSALPTLVMLAVNLVQWAVALARRQYPDGGRYDALPHTPHSPSLKSRRLTARGSWATAARRVQWWLADDVVLFGQVYGQREQWAVGAAWMLVLLVLCVVQTGRDYMHLTKRFGIVAVSQFPLHYIMAMRYVNPLQAVFGTSHEQLNRWHRVLGAIVYTLLLLHTVFYLNFFAQTGDFWRRLLRPVVALGLTAFAGMTLLSTTALAVVRRWSYRVFFVTHVVVAFAVPALVIFHAHHANNYVAAALLLFIADLTLRKIHTVTTQATVEAIPGTQLVRLTAPIPPAQMAAFRRYPGRHVYVSLPAAARLVSLSAASLVASLTFVLFEFLFNPFTIAAVNEPASDVTLIVRTRGGPMSAALAKHAGVGSVVPTTATTIHDEAHDSDEDETTPAIPAVSHEQRDTMVAAHSIPISLEGPYGSSAYFPELTAAHFDRVLLVAGGVGATFVVPLYRFIADSSTAHTTGPGATSAARRNSASSALKVDLVWSVRGAGDATWAVVTGQDGSGRSLLEDRNVHIFLTGNSANGRGDGAGVAPVDAASAAVELTALRRDRHPSAPSSPSDAAAAAPRSRFASPTGTTSRQRPDFRRIVDDVFRHGSEERVAVLSCGPEAMVQDLRAAVAPWVHKGRSVWWHNESFGW